MVVPVGRDNQICIDKIVIDKICHSLSKHNYETGGILGSRDDVIVEFEFDTYSSHELYEYYPATDFLEKIINEDWRRKNISFVGMIHSHMHNSEISTQDIAYCQEIIKANDSFNELIIGVLDLSDENNQIAWYSVNMIYAEKISAIYL